jgi:hypothetical protein
MRWFRHMSDANRDEKLMLIRDKFGMAGYGLYWVVVETIAEQMDETDDCSVTLSAKSWRKITETYPKTFNAFLELCETYSLLIKKSEGALITVSCPNLLKYRDEYTKKRKTCPDKLRTNSGQTPDKLRTHSGYVSDVPLKLLEENSGYSGKNGEQSSVEKKAPEGAKYSSTFEAFWKEYPKKVGKGAAYNVWLRIGKKKDTSAKTIIEAIQRQVEENHFVGRNGEQFVPNPATWLNQRRWEDEIGGKQEDWRSLTEKYGG